MFVSVGGSFSDGINRATTTAPGVNLVDAIAHFCSRQLESCTLFETKVVVADDMMPVMTSWQK